jgi:quinolinate synthase
LSSELLERIDALKKELNAVILAHNYQPDEIQDMADFCGDSLGLSIEASRTDADVIVFCGVRFMAETAAILSPNKTVLLPEKNAGCPMADMITARELTKLRQEYPDALVVSYVNSTAEVKALSDYCCTSSNAVELVESLPSDKKVIFVPDRHLGAHVRQRTGRELLLWPGYCGTHVKITPEDIEQARTQYPDAIVMAHPECTEAVKDVADELLSTGQMLKFASTSEAKSFIISTEIGIIHTLKRQNPEKVFIAASKRAVCPNMKRITLEKVVWSMEDMRYRISVPEDVMTGARKALERMVEVVPTT